MRFPLVVCAFVCFAVMTIPSFGQSPNGNINGLVADSTNAAVADADIVAVNDVTGVQYTTKTNNEGIYVLPNLPPGPYRVQVSKIGFKTLIKPDITLNVQDSLSINFTLLVGAFHEIVTVLGGAPLVNTENATVSTVVDRQFADNLPMNGRSFQSLFELTPGVVLTTSNASDGGQFSINGQRAASNYWTVDGVSANIGIGASPSPFAVAGNGLAGALGSFSAMGGTNSLVSIDAMQEFRIQTSTYAPEFGRTPGGQISIVTRSGTNQFHGTLFDYLRNDVLDASNWFNGYTNNPPLPKAKERQNDFGGTIGGPILKDRTFFFFSYEGLRLRLPETELTTVPDLAARSSATPAMQPYLDAFPIPNGPDNPVAGVAQFNASYSNPSGLDAYSLRLDHKLTDKLNIFGRYNYSPSSIQQRGEYPYYSLSTVSSTRITTQTATLGATWALSSTLAQDLRFNYSRTNGSTNGSLDNFGGATPLSTVSFPSPFTPGNSLLNFEIFSLQNGSLATGPFGRNVQRQINFVYSLSWQKGAHSLKFGADFRRLSPISEPNAYEQIAYMEDVPNAENGNLLESSVGTNLESTLLFRNLGVYAQDTWRASSRLTLTYGVRWDVDFVPRSLSGPSLPAVTGFNLNDFSKLALAPGGTTPYRTSFDDFAPRLGFAFLLSQSRDWQTVLRGGFGVFYDLATSEIGNNIGTGTYPFGSVAFTSGGTFPLSPSAAQPPPITPAGLTSGILLALNPNLRQPYTLEWNTAFEQALGAQQRFTVSYLGAAGRRLLQTAFVASPTPSLGGADLISNVGTSDYNALQLQFQRRMSSGLQVLASYTWAHSIDSGSAGSTAVASNSLIPSASANRAASDFDIRNAVSAGITYEIPAPKVSPLVNALLRGWSTDNIVQVRTAPPVDISDVLVGEFDGGVIGDTRPDFVPGAPLYLYGLRFPGGKGFNPGAFTSPPIDPNTGLALRQGDVPRNVLRGFGAAQWDLAVHRTISIREPVTLQFRAEMFNVLNHPNFGQPNGQFGTALFGLSNQMLAQSLSANNLGGGGFNPLYQIGGPRSIQFALKLEF